ncbi:MAG: hypothetical protein ACLFUL_06315 [Desulfobacteraceae bacterium]
MPWEEEGQQGPAAGDQGNGQGTGAEGQQEQGQQGQEQGQQGQQGDQGGQQNDAARVAQAMREELNQIKQQNQLLQQQVQFYQANMGQGLPQGQQSQQAQDPFAGLDEDDVVDVPTMKKIFNQFQQTTSQQLREIQLRAQFPDIEQTIQTYLPNALNKNPSLQKALRQSGDPLLAYQIATYEKELQEGANGQGQGNGQGQQGQGQDTTQRILDNLGKPQNPGSTGGGGSGVDAADAYLNMSDDDLEKRIARVKGG